MLRNICLGVQELVDQTPDDLFVRRVSLQGVGEDFLFLVFDVLHGSFYAHGLCLCLENRHERNKKTAKGLIPWPLAHFF